MIEIAKISYLSIESYEEDNAEIKKLLLLKL